MVCHQTDKDRWMSSTNRSRNQPARVDLRPIWILDRTPSTTSCCVRWCCFILHWTWSTAAAVTFFGLLSRLGDKPLNSYSNSSSIIAVSKTGLTAVLIRCNRDFCPSTLVHHQSSVTPGLHPASVYYSKCYQVYKCINLYRVEAGPSPMLMYLPSDTAAVAYLASGSGFTPTICCDPYMTQR